MRTIIAVFALLVVTTPIGFSQAPSQPQSGGPAFDVVSIKRNTSGFLVNSVNQQRPDGGFTMTNVPVGTFIARAYQPAVPADMVGLPAWAMSERYDVSATSSLSQATPDERIAMLRAMLADRFKLVVHIEKREHPIYELLLARSDGRLGSGLTHIDADCDAKLAADRAAAEAALAGGTPPPRPQLPDFNAPPPPCTLRSVGANPRDPSRVGDVLEGETSMTNLAAFLRIATGRVVVDKTGLAGSYRVRMTYDMQASRRGPDVTPPPDAAPAVFSAIQDQLGLKLNSSRAERDTLIIDRLERPTEN